MWEKKTHIMEEIDHFPNENFKNDAGVYGLLTLVSWIGFLDKMRGFDSIRKLIVLFD